MKTGYEKEIGEVIAAGRRVQEKVRDITLKALTQHELDHAAVRKVTHEVADAVRSAAKAQGESAKQAAKDGLDGVTQALAHAAQALKLSIEEAAGRVEAFSREDLAKARADLTELEKMLAEHARASGAAFGRHMEEIGPLAGRMAEAGRAQFDASLAAAAASGAMLARAASGALAGMAETLAAKSRPKPPPH